MDMDIAERFSRRSVKIFLLRLFLGVFFLYISLHKIIHPAEFGDVIAEYNLLPYWIINFMAITLPWFEFWTGVLLIAGIFVRSCTTIQLIMLIVFTLAIGLNIARGMEFYCGCFGDETSLSGTNYVHILINIILIISVIMLFVLERRRFSHRFFPKADGPKKS